MRRCQAAVPRSLAGGLEPPSCSLETGKDGLHLGDHKAHKTVPHVGRITWKWKNRNQSKRTQPPVIELPAATNPHLTGRIKAPRCGCPDWWTGHGHRAPCLMA